MKNKIVKIVVIILAVLVLLFIAVRAYLYIEEKRRADAPGNTEEYSMELIEQKAASPLNGKTIIFLGSSVTYGAAAEGQSFVEYLEHRDGVNAIKEAKSGTTLVDKNSVLASVAFGNGDSYVKRLRQLDPAAKVDCVLIQLSTNDATMKLPLGEISESKELSDFNTKTVSGAMEYIIRYAEDTWKCPVVFYTGAYYDSEPYAAMVRRLLELRGKWDIGVIDLYTDKEFNDIDKETYRRLPDVTLIDQIRDVYAALTFTRENAESFRLNMDKVFLTGDSAGALLSLFALAINNSEALQRDFGIAPHGIDFKAANAISVMLDTVRGGILGTIRANILSEEDSVKPFAKYIKNPSLMIPETKLPPMFLVTSAEDIIRNDTLLQGEVKVMLTETTVNKLQEMKLSVMAKAFRAQLTDPNLQGMSFEDRFGLIVDQEWTSRKNNHLKRLIKQARFSDPGACVEDIEYHEDRNLDQTQIARLSGCDYIAERHIPSCLAS